jgi:hypothetical protein
MTRRSSSTALASCKTPVFCQLFLCLSRACLGKQSAFEYENGATKTRFPPPRQTQQRGRSSLHRSNNDASGSHWTARRQKSSAARVRLLLQPRALPHLWKTHISFGGSSVLCLSRARLGKMIVFSSCKMAHEKPPILGKRLFLRHL